VATYRVWEVTGSRRFAPAQRNVGPPERGHVRMRVLSCGICHSDAGMVEGRRADPNRPAVPGHEFVGVIDAVGAGVTSWQIGERVRVGYLGGNCGICERGRWGDFVNCADQPATGSSVDSSYAEVTYARASALARIPVNLTQVDASRLGGWHRRRGRQTTGRRRRCAASFFPDTPTSREARPATPQETRPAHDRTRRTHHVANAQRPLRRGPEMGATPDLSMLQRLSAVKQPVFVANDDDDLMILPWYSYLVRSLLPNADVKIYPDSAHGFLFQHFANFSADVLAFLA
jgi:hypothetical protein